MSSLKGFTSNLFVFILLSLLISCVSQQTIQNAWEPRFSIARQAASEIDSFTVCIAFDTNVAFQMPFDSLIGQTKSIFNSIYPNKTISYNVYYDDYLIANDLLNNDIGGSEGLIFYIVFENSYNSFASKYSLDMAIYGKNATTNTILTKKFLGYYESLGMIATMESDYKDVIVTFMKDEYTKYLRNVFLGENNI